MEHLDEKLPKMEHLDSTKVAHTMYTYTTSPPKDGTS